MPSIIEQLAEELNTSTASVSRALNGKAGVGEDLRLRILQRAKELNYVPNLTARAFSQSKTYAVGFFIAEKEGISVFNDPFYGDILYGAEKTLTQTDYHLIVATLSATHFQAPTKFRFIREKRIDGMILAGPDIPAQFIRAMAKTGKPVILIDNRLPDSNTHSINADDFSGARSAAEYLLSCGHRSIGILAGPPTFASSHLRVNGFQSVLIERNLPPATLHQHPEHTLIQQGKALFQSMWEGGYRPTAIFATTDAMAIGAMQSAKALGLRVPEDISVMGFDDIYWAQIADPPLTTIRIPKTLMGQESVSRLISLLEKPDLEPTQLSLQVRLVERSSVRCID